MPRFINPCMLIAILAVFTGSARGFIRVDEPFSKITGASSQIVVGKVKAVNVPNKRVTVSIERSIKSAKGVDPLTGEFAVQIDEPAELLKAVAVDQPVLVFEAGKAALLHLADTWIQAERAAPKAWRAFGKHDVAKSFPGRTAGLVKLVEVIQAGKIPKNFNAKDRDSLTAAELEKLGNPLLDQFEHSTWGNRSSLGDVGIGTSLTAVDVNGDKQADVLVVGDKGVRYYLGGGSGKPVAEATKPWGLATAAARKATFGDVNGDGKPDLLLDTLWINNGSKFTEAKSALNLSGIAAPLAVTLADVTGDKKPDALVLDKTGHLHVFVNPGADDQPWKALPARKLWSGGDAPLAANFGDFGDNGLPHAMVVFPNDLIRYSAVDDGSLPVDYEHLTGFPKKGPGVAKGSQYFPVKDLLAATAIDVNGGDGRLDFMVATKKGKGGDIGLTNRGYGAFWPNNEAGIAGRGDKAVIAALTAADMGGTGRHALLILTTKGELIQVDSPPYKKGKPVE